MAIIAVTEASAVVADVAVISTSTQSLSSVTLTDYPTAPDRIETRL
jgi:hypothetical protein